MNTPPPTDDAHGPDFSLDTPLGDTTGLHEQRLNPRTEPQGTHTDLGPVLDLSTHGARVEISGHCPVGLGDRLTLDLDHPQANLRIEARVIHLEALGFRHFVVGLMFTDPTDAQRDTLRQLVGIDPPSLKVA